MIHLSSSLVRFVTIIPCQHAWSQIYPYSATTRDKVFIPASRFVTYSPNPILESASLNIPDTSCLRLGFLEIESALGSFMQKVYWGVLLRDTPIREWERGLGRGRGGPVIWLLLRPLPLWIRDGSSELLLIEAGGPGFFPSHQPVNDCRPPFGQGITF